MMTKVVNIYPTTPILRVNPPIRFTVYKTTKSTAEIKACILSDAIVEEILPDGNTLRLNLNNYNKVNYVAPKPVKAKKEDADINNIPVLDVKDVLPPSVTVVSTEKPKPLFKKAEEAKKVIEESTEKVDTPKPVIEEPKFGKNRRKNRRKNRQTNENKVADSTNTSEDTVVETTASADATESEPIIETIDVESVL